MKWISDTTVDHLCEIAHAADLEGTKYRLQGEIGRGGMGVVYLAYDTELRRQVAVKILHTTSLVPAMTDRMLWEARIIAGLEHPGIVPLHDAGILPDGRVFYVMKFVRGSRLDQYTLSQESNFDRLHVFLRVCEAVAFAHSCGVVHRDLKPENIMLGPFGEVMVMDWGTAKIVRRPTTSSRLKRSLRSTDNEVDQEAHSSYSLGPRASRPQSHPRSNIAGETPAVPVNSLNGIGGPVEQISLGKPQSARYLSPGFLSADRPRTTHGEVMGTPAYMAPEQARGGVDLDERCDVYALGAILYFVLTEQAPPFADSKSGPTLVAPRALNPKLAKPLEAICLRALSTNPDERYNSVNQMATDISRFLEGNPVSAYRENILERTNRWLVRHRFLVLLLLAYLLMRILLILV